MPTHGQYSCYKYRVPPVYDATGIGFPRSGTRKFEDGSPDYSNRQRALLYSRMRAWHGYGKIGRRCARNLRRLA